MIQKCSFNLPRGASFFQFQQWVEMVWIDDGTNTQHQHNTQNLVTKVRKGWGIARTLQLTPFYEEWWRPPQKCPQWPFQYTPFLHLLPDHPDSLGSTFPLSPPPYYFQNAMMCHHQQQQTKLQLRSLCALMLSYVDDRCNVGTLLHQLLKLFQHMHHQCTLRSSLTPTTDQ